MKNFVLGIDPGKSGGLVGLTNGTVNFVDRMPQGPNGLWDYFEDSGLRLVLQSMEINSHVYIEDVHSMPTDGSKSAFTFGRQLGWLDMLITRVNIPIHRVRPAVWMDTFSLKRAKPDETRYNYKKRIVTEAKRLSSVSYRPQIDLYTADAYLIARYGFLQEKSKKQ